MCSFKTIVRALYKKDPDECDETTYKQLCRNMNQLIAVSSVVLWTVLGLAPLAIPSVILDVTIFLLGASTAKAISNLYGYNT